MGQRQLIGPGVYDEAKRFAEAITMAYHRSWRAHASSEYLIRMAQDAAQGMGGSSYIQAVLRASPVFGDGS